jgi:2-polyprenyl-3-methyl-5-hydroxy-6-metoxy-1,4-benzoquinol methylase
MLIKAKKKAGKKLNIDFVKQDITKYKPKKKFDLIISMLVQDHIKNLSSAINVINKASKIGTEVVISNVHPDLIRKFANPKTGRGLGKILEGYAVDQFYHPLELYLELFNNKGFKLTKLKNIFIEKKYHSIKRYKPLMGLKDKSIGIIMKFEKIK